MNIRKGLLVLVMSLLVIISFRASAGDDMSIDVPSNQKSFNVVLEANATTGFQWSVQQFNKKLLTLIASEYQAPHGQRVGEGGQMKFTFALIEGKKYPAQTNLTFKYSRSWEPDSATVKKVTVHFVH